MNVDSAELKAIAEKVDRHERLVGRDGQVLFDPATDLHFVGVLADRQRERRHGDTVYYNLNAHLNPTNICTLRCPLCAYSRGADQAGAYEMTLDEVESVGRAATAGGCTEIHIVSGIHPDKPYVWYRDIVARLHHCFPALHIKAFTAIEIAHFAERQGRSVAWVLEDLMRAGLGSLPGGGAEIFADAVRARLAPRKGSAETYLQIHETAHGLGLKSNVTMLFGHIESIADRVDHLLRIRRLQDRTGGFQAFVPLAFHPRGTQFSHLSQVTGLEQLRCIAVSRLLLDNVPHIKAYWVSLGLGTAQTALSYGANDLDGTVSEERIHHEAGSEAPQALSVGALRQLITEAGRHPVERDSLYREVVRSSGDPA